MVDYSQHQIFVDQIVHNTSIDLCQKLRIISGGGADSFGHTSQLVGNISPTINVKLFIKAYINTPLEFTPEADLLFAVLSQSKLNILNIARKLSSFSNPNQAYCTKLLHMYEHLYDASEYALLQLTDGVYKSIFFHHVMKAGGSTFQRSLVDSFGFNSTQLSKNKPIVSNGFHSWSGFLSQKGLVWVDWDPILYYSGFPMVSEAHFPITPLATKLDRIYRPIVLRDPVKRFFSLYKMWIDYPLVSTWYSRGSKSFTKKVPPHRKAAQLFFFNQNLDLSHAMHTAKSKKVSIYFIDKLNQYSFTDIFPNLHIVFESKNHSPRHLSKRDSTNLLSDLTNDPIFKRELVFINQLREWQSLPLYQFNS